MSSYKVRPRPIPGLSFGAEARALLVLRIAGGSMIFYIHGWHKLLGGIAYFRSGQPWKLAEEVAEMHVPYALFAAVIATMIQFICSLSITVGFFTRINALLLATALGGAVLQNLLAGRDPQLAILYCVLVLTVAIAGGGPVSLDARLAQARSTITML